jgi:hypothetical protein
VGALGGNFNQSDYSYVQVGGQLALRDPVQFASDVVPPGTYYLTNGTLSVANGVYAGGFPGPGKFVQYGGSNLLSSVSVDIDAEFDIYGGQMTVTNGITVGIGDYANYANFFQYGGNVNADTTINGNYTLTAGTISGRMILAAGGERVDASMLQSGGTNFATSMDMGHPNQFGGAAHYTLSNGVVHVDSSTTFGGGQFSQYSGQNIIVSDLVMQGRDVGVGNIYAEYVLAGGTLSVGGLTEGLAAHFTQNGGANLIAGTLVVTSTPPRQISYYNLGGGNLAVKDIFIGLGAYFQHNSGNISHSGILTLAQGTWYAATGDYGLGPLQLGGPNTNSTITFPSGSSILRLANSSGQTWASGAVLTVNKWHGSVAGGGATQLYFGSNSSGLTSQQVAQVKFQLSGSAYPATILSTGEVVPVSPPVLTFTRANGTLILIWGSGWTLQSATNVGGPYQDVQNAASPLSVNMTQPRQFFRLRQ